MQQTVLITGANRGIGLALTEAFLAKGDDVIGTCRDPLKATKLQAIAAQTQALSIVRLDVTDDQSIASAATELAGRTIDILINNAGILSGANPTMSATQRDPSQTLGTIDAKGLEKIYRTNIVGPVMVTQALLDNLRQSKKPRVVMISSGWGSIEAMTDDVPLGYGSSKAALNFVAKNLSLSLAKEKFVIAAFAPGWIETDMGGKGADWTPAQCASRLLPLIEGLTKEQNGQFIRHTGEIVPW